MDFPQCDITLCSNPFPKPIENVVFSAKWNVHIWNRLRKCFSWLYTGTLKRYPLQSSNFRRLKINLESSCCDLLLEHFLNFSQPIAKCAQGCRAQRAHAPAHYSVNSVNLVLLDLLSSSRLLEVTIVTFSSDSSRKWLSPWSVTQNLSRSWRRAIWCWRTIGSVSGCHPLS